MSLKNYGFFFIYDYKFAPDNDWPIYPTCCCQCRSRCFLGLSFAVWYWHAPPPIDPCVKIAGQTYVPPSDALSCFKSFAFNETLRQNVLTDMARVFDTFILLPDFPATFQESTNDIRATLSKLNSTTFQVRGSPTLPITLLNFISLGRISTRPCTILLPN